MLFREVSERDYGIDAIIEYFNNDKVTGKIALVQLKGTSKEIESLKKFPFVSCSISTSSAKYSFQKNIPVFLIYSSLKDESSFYYVCLQDIKLDHQLIERQKEITIRIPEDNIITGDTTVLIKKINEYY